MKRKKLTTLQVSWLTTIIVCLVLLLSTLAALLWPRTVPLSECSATYRRYTGHKDIGAAYIKDYRINDSVSVSITLLEAKTDSAWESLLKDFNTTPPPKEFIGHINNTSRLAPKKDYSLPKDSILLNNDFIHIAWLSHEFTIFHIESKEQAQALYSFQVRKAKQTLKKTKYEQIN